MNKTVSWFVIFCSFLGLLSQPLKAEPEEMQEKFPVFQTLPETKSLLSSPQFLVIDDFNRQKMSNAFGALWQNKVPAIGAFDLFLTDSDARNPDRGGSLEAAIHLKPGEEATLISRLNDLDVSQAAFLAFQCRVVSEKQKSGKIKVVLTDTSRETREMEVTEVCLGEPEVWQEVILPVKGFAELDLDRLFSIRFVFQAEETLHVRWGLDELAFFGFNDVAFESNADNLWGFPLVAFDEARREHLRKEDRDYWFLHKIARDTWKFFENSRDRKTHLIVDHIRAGDAPLAAAYTSPTNVAMDLMSTVAAMDLDIISRDEAVERSLQVFDTLEGLRRFDGFFYNFYDTRRLTVTRSYISSIDNAWLAIALVVMRQAFPEELGARASAILNSFTFEDFLDPENNQLVIGFDVPKREFGQYHYGMLVTEARAMSYYAIGKGDVPADHWWFLFRTLPAVWKWQKQDPKGKSKTRDGINYFQGYYEYNKKKFVPSWGGSLFEYLMPTLVLDEKRKAPEGLGRNNRMAVELHRDYAVEKGYPVWGLSPAAITNGRRWQYLEFGATPLGAKGYPDRAVVTPHVSFLALDPHPEMALENIRNLLGYPGMYGNYGFYDAVNLKNGKVNPQYLALDQGMILVAIANYLKDGSIQNRFHADPVGQNAEHLLEEEFFK